MPVSDRDDPMPYEHQTVRLHRQNLLDFESDLFHITITMKSGYNLNPFSWVFLCQLRLKTSERYRDLPG